MTTPDNVVDKIVVTRSGTKLSKSLMESFIRQQKELQNCEKTILLTQNPNN